jgi:hypothetical protein
MTPPVFRSLTPDGVQDGVFSPLNFFVSFQYIGINHSELQILIYWAIDAQNEYKDTDARIFGSSYTMMSVSMWKGFFMRRYIGFIERI